MAYVHVRVACGVVRRRAVCKTVGSAYVGSNPTPATTCENGPLAAETRPRGRFLLRHVAYHRVSLCVDMLRCPRTYRDIVRAGRAAADGRGRSGYADRPPGPSRPLRRLSTDGHGRAY